MRDRIMGFVGGLFVAFCILAMAGSEVSVRTETDGVVTVERMPISPAPSNLVYYTGSDIVPLYTNTCFGTLENPILAINVSTDSLHFVASDGTVQGTIRASGGRIEIPRMQLDRSGYPEQGQIQERLEAVEILLGLRDQ